jgi:hypothetical protein
MAFLSFSLDLNGWYYGEVLFKGELGFRRLPPFCETHRPGGCARPGGRIWEGHASLFAAGGESVLPDGYIRLTEASGTRYEDGNTVLERDEHLFTVITNVHLAGVNISKIGRVVKELPSYKATIIGIHRMASKQRVLLTVYSKWCAVNGFF